MGFFLAIIVPMPTLQRFRDAPSLMRWVLLWFVLAIGVAVASPLVKPVSLSLICSATGSTLVATGDDGSLPSPSHASTLDCVLCLPAAAPPASPVVAMLAPAPRVERPRTVWAPVAWRTSEPTSARDPPNFF